MVIVAGHERSRSGSGSHRVLARPFVGPHCHAKPGVHVC
jgi:hypothetical protein